MTGYIALKGTSALAKQFKDQLDEHFPGYLSRSALAFGTSDLADASNALEIINDYLGACSEESREECCAVEIADGGLLTALWELSKVCSCGFELDLRKIPVKQETIEICELLEVNPYHLSSGGALIVIAPEGQALCERLKSAGVPAVIVGSTNETKAHTLLNDGTVSYINRPEPDELIRLGLL